MYHIFSIRSLADRYLGCFHFLAMVSRAAMNTDEEVPLEEDLKSSGYIPKSTMEYYRSPEFLVYTKILRV